MRRRSRDLERMIEAVLADEPIPPGRLNPEEADVLRLAIDLRASRPGTDLPDEDFVAGLRRRVAAESAPEGDGSAEDDT